MDYKPLPEKEEDIEKKIVDAAYGVHREFYFCAFGIDNK